MRRTLLEGLCLAVCGLVLALAANALSPRGLKLTRDYFPSATRPLPVVAASSSTNALTAGGTNTVSKVQAIIDRIQGHGFRVGDSNLVSQLYQDPRYAQGLVIFVDARDDAHYQAGHIPGAYQFDHYRPEPHLPALLPAVQIAEEILVYCNGGDCEDSEFAALFLRDSAGVPGSKIVVYAGGMAEWKTNNLPVEVGGFRSGVLLSQ